MDICRFEIKNKKNPERMTEHGIANKCLMIFPNSKMIIFISWQASNLGKKIQSGLDWNQLSHEDGFETCLKVKIGSILTKLSMCCCPLVYAFWNVQIGEENIIYGRIYA